jgi:carbon starvation protein CstA
MDFGLLWRYFSWANQITAAIALWIGEFVPKENALYHCSRARFYYICSWFLSFYDPTIGFGLEVMTSNLID